MRKHLLNAAYGVLDYAAYPIGMLLVAPIVLHRLGVARYGVWTVAAAAVSMGSIIASGFGDANIQQVASLRGLGRQDCLLRTVRCMIGINLVLGTVLALLVWLLAPWLTRHVVAANAALQQDCLWSLRLAGILLWLRTMESVCISTQRAFERYGPAMCISILARVLSLAAAGALTYILHRVTGMLAATVLINLLGTAVQYAHLRRHLHAATLVPVLDGRVLQALLGFGAFSWLQAVASVVFSQADRLVLGVSLGAVALASYALCTQLAQPVYGFAASGLHFLFPHLAERRASHTLFDHRRVVLAAFACNLLFVTSAAAALLLFGPHILQAWGGNAIASASTSIFPIIVWSSALLGLNVTGTYTLFALGRIRFVTCINLAGGGAMLLLIFFLLPRIGSYGLALARLAYGVITLLLYLPLLRLLSGAPAPVAKPAWEET